MVKKRDIASGHAEIEFAFLRCTVYMFVFMLSLYLFINSPDNSDLHAHMRFIEQLDKGNLVVPHFLYHLIVYGISKTSHISFFHTSCLVLASFVVISMFLIENILRSFLKGVYSNCFLLFVSLMLTYVSSVYFPLIHINPYIGTWSPNPLHNPTFIVAKPFVLLSFYLYSLEIIQGTYFEKRFSVIRISILLAICALIKPNFILAFAPASIAYCFFCSDRKMAMLRKTGLLLLPVSGVLLFQYLFTYYCDATSSTSSIQFCFFEVWKMYAKSVPIAVLQGVAFPLVVLMVTLPRLSKDKTLFLSWILFVISLFIFGLLCETGHRKEHGNFGWTYMFCLNILFVFSFISFLRWASDAFQNSTIFQAKLFLCFMTFLLHLFSGIYYVRYLMSGNDY